ncbi:MAG: hypothetical protein H6573_22785 [Lewinellaceae bacterium]|nr:hypothetical protein [Lewinellaceae bacterium]
MYNGKELNGDYEINLMDYGARWYDGALGRWTAVDPSAEKYESLTPYAYVGNMPVKAVDPDGREIIIILGRDENENISKTVKYSNGKLYNNDGSLYAGNDRFALYVKSHLTKLESLEDNYVREVVSSLASSCYSHYIEGNDFEYGGATTSPLKSANSANEGVPQGSFLNIPETEELFKQRLGKEGVEFSSTAIIGHELQHAYELDQGLKEGEYFIKNSADDPSEQRAVNFENRIRRALGLKLDWSYGNKEIPKSAREDISKKRSTKDDAPKSY